MSRASLLGLSILLTAATILPNTLLADCKFEKIIQGDELPIGIMLEWSTCTEESNSMFIIEKSEDGIAFKNIGAVKGAGHSEAIQEYTFLDVNARAERLYYRLRQIDFDGSFSFSQVFTLNKKTPNQFTVAHLSSITAVEKFDVSIDVFRPGKIIYQLIDLQGEVLWSETVKTKTGINKLSVNLDKYPEKIYRLSIKMQDEEEFLTFKKISEQENKKLNFAISKDCKK